MGFSVRQVGEAEIRDRRGLRLRRSRDELQGLAGDGRSLKTGREDPRQPAAGLQKGSGGQLFNPGSSLHPEAGVLLRLEVRVGEAGFPGGVCRSTSSSA